MKRGPKSAAELAIQKPADLSRVQRLKAPVHLTDAERSVWLATVNPLPADAFRDEHAALLELYVGHVVRARLLADEIHAFERAWLARDGGLERFERMLRMAERESRAASSLATRLRITRQSLHPETAARTARRPGAGRRPWDA